MMYKKSVKKIIVLIFVVLIATVIGGMPVFAADYPDPESDFFVNDFAGVISAQDEQNIKLTGEKLFSDTTAQAVVVTVQTLNGEDISSYSIGLARQWGIGSADEDNGVLLILAVEEREVRIEVGSGLEGALTDAKTGRILDLYGMDYFRNNDFSSGISEVYSSIVNEIYIEYDMEPSADYTPVEESEEGSGVFEIARIVLIVLIVLLAVRTRRTRGGPGAGMPFFFFSGHGNHNGGGFSGGRGGGFSGGGGGFSGGGSSRGF